MSGSTDVATPRSTRARLYRRVAMVAVIVFGLVAGLNALFSWRPLFERTENSSVDTGDLTGVRIETRGRIVLVAGNGGAVEVRATLRWSVLEPSTESVVEGRTLALTGDCPPVVRFGCDVEYRVAVPPGITVTAVTSSGGVSAVDLRVARFDARSSSGGIEASFADAPGHVQAVTSAGGITLTMPPGSYDVDATSAAGGVHVDVIQDPDAPNKIVARSAAGGVRIG
jgi:hypothetical protein